MKAQLTKADLAEKAGITVRTVDDLEKGRRTRVQEKTLKLLALALGIPYETFLAECQLIINETNNHSPAPLGRRIAVARWPIIIMAVLVIAALVVRQLAVTNPNIRADGNTITAVDRFFGFKLWEHTHVSPVILNGMIDNQPPRWPGKPWIVYGLSAEASDGGQVFVRERSSGKLIFKTTPDREKLACIFGAGMMDQGCFGARSVQFFDFTNDGRPELLVIFLHGKWYPAYITIYNESGTEVTSYYHHGHFNSIHVDDIDMDGKNELLLAGTSNARGSIGATLIMLDERHCGGGYVIPADDAACTLMDSSRVRIVFPNLDLAYMQLWELERLRADHIKTYTDHDGRRMISVDIGHSSNSSIMVTLDAALRPLSVQLTDYFRVKMRTWPEELRPPDSYFEEWLTRAVRYEEGRRVE